MAPAGRVIEFRSPVDGSLHPAAVCATDDDLAPKPLLLEVSPGAIADLDAAVALTEEIAGVAAAAGRSCVVLRPTGRGPGTVYQGYGEVDVLEAIEAVAAAHAIDRDRITVSGTSMGGAATWYLLSHYPDLFAAGAPFCGYSDYRLWEKPGGLTFPMRPWEEPSWRARSAALLVESIDRIPLWVVHGEWDRAVGGGVSVEQSRTIVRALRERGSPVRYTELPGAGHDIRRPPIFHEVIRWLLDQRRGPDPGRVSFATGTLRHNASRWVRIDQLARSGERGTVEAEVEADGVLRVATANVRTLTLGRMGAGRQPTGLELDGQTIATDGADPTDATDADATAADTTTATPDLTTTTATFQRDRAGRWTRGTPEQRAEKRHGASGPIGDLFFERTILVPGTIGDESATFFNQWLAEEAASFYRSRNGGVHRGGIMGVNHVDLPIVRDVDLSAEDGTTSNLILYGTPSTNAVLREFARALPVAYGPDWIRLGSREYRDPRVSLFAVFPHPEHASRYLAVHGGPAADAVTWGSHLDMALLPDYLVYAGGETLAWGFFDNAWQPEEGG